MEGYQYIRKCDEVVSEASLLYEPSLVIINTDDSGSMQWNDFYSAIAGGRYLIEYLKNHHTDHSKVDLQLWYNTCPGVSCSYKGKLIDQIPEN